MENIFMPKPHKIISVKKMTDIEYLFRVECPEAKDIKFG